MRRVSHLFADLLLVLIIIVAVQVQSRLLLPIAIPTTDRTLIELNSYLTLGLISFAVLAPAFVRAAKLRTRPGR